MKHVLFSCVFAIALGNKEGQLTREEVQQMVEFITIEINDYSTMSATFRNEKIELIGSVVTNW